MADAIAVSPQPEESPDSVLLYRRGRTYCYNDPEAAVAAVANNATAVAVHTSNNQSGYFSFTLRPPSKVSYLDLHWPYGVPKSIIDLAVISDVLTSDENLVLLRLSLIDTCPTVSDLFVYTAGPSSPPSLRRLPSCTETHSLVGRSEFLTVDSDIGILCQGDPNNCNCVVADLIFSWKRIDNDYRGDHSSPRIAVLCTFSSKKGEWKANEMLAPQQGQFPVLWYCDRVLPFAGRFLCWVDYYNGIVFCDFSDEDSPVLRYVPAPGNQKYSDQTMLDRGVPESFRNVSVSQGMMCFIHIDDDLKDSGLMITVWNLMMGDSWNWEIHRMINLDDLYVQQAYKVLGLSPLRPLFPVVSKNNPDVLFCIVREEIYSGRVWIMKVDMEQKLLLSCDRYINEQFVFHRDVVDYSNYFHEAPLLPSDIARYLSKPPGLPWDGDKSGTQPAKRSKLAF